MKKSTAGMVVLHFFLILFAIVVLIPFYWMILTSFKSEGDFYAKTTGLFLQNPVMDNYIALFTETNAVRWFVNSFLVSLLSTALGIFICALAGFAFGAYQFKGKQVLFWTVLASVAIPEIVTIIPLFKMMVDIKLIDTYFAVILPYAVSMFGIFMMK